jgi:Ran GTPase-activating protein (RanGAP) involved in mRNA processing and transport
MSSPSQVYQKRIHDILHSAKMPDEVLFGKFQVDGHATQNAVELPGWKALTPDQFWQLVQKLATCSNITRFDFSGNTVGPRAFAVLMQVLSLQKGLTHIDLTDCDIRDVGCKNLANAIEVHCVVQFLGLSRNRIRRTGCKMLSRALKKCITLQHIDLSHNALRSRGLMCIQQPLRGQSNLLHIDFSACGFDNQSFFWMCDALTHCSSLKHIAFADNRLGKDEVEILTKALKQQTSLEYLNLSGNFFGPSASIKIFASLKDGTSLQHVEVAQNLFLDRGLVALTNSLRSHSNLRYLGISGNTITAIGFQTLTSALHHFHHLSYCDISHNTIDRRTAGNISEMFTQHLSNIETVNVSHSKMSGEAVLVISQALATRPKLKHVDVRGNECNASTCFSICDNFKSLTNLESLCLDKDCELMAECVASKPYLGKFPPPPAELLACKSWAELVRFMQNPSASTWKAICAKKIPSATCPHDDAAFDSDIHGEDVASEPESVIEGSSCEESTENDDCSTSSDDNADDDLEGAGQDDASSDSSKASHAAADIGSKRKVAESRPDVVVGSAAPAAKHKAPPASFQAALLAVCKAAVAPAASAPASDATLPASAQPPKRMSKSAIADVVIKGELTQLPFDYLKQMCNDSNISSAGYKSALIKRLQARYLNKYTKLFAE